MTENERQAIHTLHEMLEAIQAPCQMHEGKTKGEIKQCNLIESWIDIFISELEDESLQKMAREMSA